MAEHAGKPKVRFAGFTETWEQRNTSYLGNFFKGQGYSKADLLPDGTPIILYGQLYTNYQFTITEVNTYAQKKKNTILSKGNEVIVPASGETAEDIARASAVRKKGVILGGDLNIIVPIPSMNAEFFALSLSNGFPQKKLAQKAQGKSVVHIHNSDIQEISITYPSLEEQNRIASFFRHLDRLITLHQRKRGRLENIKKAMLEKMFPKNGADVPEVRFVGFTEAWEQRKLGEVGTTFTGLSGKKASDFGHGKASLITYMNVFSNPIANPNMIENVEVDSRQREVEVGDVFFTTSSETPEEVGMSSVLKKKIGITYLNSFCFGFRPSVKFDLDYLAFMLRSESVRKQIKLLAQGISRFNIAKTKMMYIDIQVPKIDEQIAIGKYFAQLDRLITLHQRKVALLQNIKKACLEKMFV